MDGFTVWIWGVLFFSHTPKPSTRPLFIKGANVVTGSLRKKESQAFLKKYSYEIFTKKSDFLASCVDGDLLTVKKPVSP